MANGNPVILGKSDTSTKETKIQAATPRTEAALSIQNLASGAILAGTLGGTGLAAGSLLGTPIRAEGYAGSGVYATCVDTRDVPGISTAVQGDVAGGFGVLGLNARGRFPESGATGRAQNAIGVDGISRRGFGVRGLTFSNRTTDSAGVLGIGSPGHGVVGIAMKPFATIFTTPPIPGGALFAGLFVGNVEVDGDFLVTGHKSAAVRHPDGSHRRLYCVEAPESWFEDVGAAELVEGRAAVEFDADFAALVRRDGYHVFLTPEGDCSGLYVAAKSKAGFEVRELGGGRSTLRFAWRVLARRADVAGERLAKVQLAERFRGADAEIPAPKAPGGRGADRLTVSLRALRARAARAKRARPKAKKKS